MYTPEKYQGFHVTGINRSGQSISRRGLAAIRRVDDNVDDIAVSICHPTDQYVKDKARMIAYGRLHSENPDQRFRFELHSDRANNTRYLRAPGYPEVRLDDGLTYPQAIAQCVQILNLRYAAESRKSN